MHKFFLIFLSCFMFAGCSSTTPKLSETKGADITFYFPKTSAETVKVTFIANSNPRIADQRIHTSVDGYPVADFKSKQALSVYVKPGQHIIEAKVIALISDSPTDSIIFEAKQGEEYFFRLCVPVLNEQIVQPISKSQL